MTQTKKSFEGDVIELLEDLPEYSVLKGQRGVIINKFDAPSEAYDIAIEDNDGEFVGYVYSVKPAQFKNIALDYFEQGIDLFNHGDFEKAKASFRAAIDLNPTFIGVLHNTVLKSFAESADYGRMITALNFVLDLNPAYEAARANLAIAFRKYGVQAAENGDIGQADTYFQMALFVSARPENVLAVHQNYSVLFTSEGLLAFEKNDPERAFHFMKQAFLSTPDEITKSNYSKSMVFLARKYIEEQKYSESLKLYEWAIKLAGLETPDVLNEYGISLGIAGRFDDAVIAFSRALELAPNDKILLQNLRLAKLKKIVNEHFASEDNNLTFETLPSSEPSEFQVEFLPTQTLQYTLAA